MRICIILICLISLSYCKVDPIKLDYCTMMSEDQSFINYDMSNMVKFNEDKIKREQLFKKNFDLLMLKTKQDGFPNVTVNDFMLDSCKYWAVSMTMIHTAQTNPELFFSNRTANLFKREMDKGNLRKAILEESCVFVASTNDLCNQLSDDIRVACDLWEVDHSIFENTVFVKCK